MYTPPSGRVAPTRRLPPPRPVLEVCIYSFHLRLEPPGEKWPITSCHLSTLGEISGASEQQTNRSTEKLL